MASTALMLVVLWQRTPYLFLALAGPLAAISLYQRSTHRALNAIRLALTDPLTGLGNHRHFQERLAARARTPPRSPARASRSACSTSTTSSRSTTSTAIPAGDRVLSQVAARLRQGGESFRLGGDEFAVLLPGVGEQLALATAQSIAERTRRRGRRPRRGADRQRGVATYPQHAHERDSLIRLADGALYWAKEHGQEPGATRARRRRRSSSRLGSACRRPARSRSTGRGGARPRRRRARRLRRQPLGARRAARRARSRSSSGFADGEVELARLAGGLHDLGKLAIPEEILRKPAALTRAERRRRRAASADRPRMLAEPRRRSDRRLGAAPPRVVGRLRLPGRARRRGDPARLAHHLRRRRVRRDDRRAARIRRRSRHEDGAPRARALLRDAVRPARSWTRSSRRSGAGSPRQAA